MPNRKEMFTPGPRILLVLTSEEAAELQSVLETRHRQLSTKTWSEIKDYTEEARENLKTSIRIAASVGKRLEQFDAFDEAASSCLLLGNDLLENIGRAVSGAVLNEVNKALGTPSIQEDGNA